MRMPSSIATWCLILFFLFYGLVSIWLGTPGHHYGTAGTWRRNLYLDWQVNTSLLKDTASPREAVSLLHEGGADTAGRFNFYSLHVMKRSAGPACGTGARRDAKRHILPCRHYPRRCVPGYSRRGTSRRKHFRRVIVHRF